MITSLVVAAVLALAQSGGGAVPTPAPAGKPVVIGTSYTIPSVVLGEPRTINVYVPPSYATGSRRYRVLYMLDGGEAQDFHHISGLAQLATISGATEEFIVVGIETRQRRRELTARSADPRYTKEWPEHGASSLFRRHIAEEVIPFVESRWRLDGESALIGESLAGLFVVETLLRSPGMFDRYVAIDPSLWWDSRALAREAPALLARHDGGRRTLWLTSGDEPGTMQDGMNRLVEALKTRAPAGLEWSYAPRPDETHASIYHPAALDALRSLWGVDTRYDAASVWWLRDGPSVPAAPAASSPTRR